MNARQLQQELKALGFYKGIIDGIIGPQTREAVFDLLAEDGVKDWRRWSWARQMVAAEQLIYTRMEIDAGSIDGLLGPQTNYARDIYEWRQSQLGPNPETWRDKEKKPVLVTPKKTVWPTQAGVPKFYGARGANQVSLALPFPMRIAWNRSQRVTKFSVHEKVHDSAKRIFNRIADAYTDAERKKHGLDLFGGCLNVRKMRGGSAWSMHSWGIAIDFDPERNALKMTRAVAYLAKPQLVRFWELWEEEGWLSLGRAKDYDWMHVQAARL